MPTPPADPVPVRTLAELVRHGPARCGSTRLVCIDGPSGSGKSTLAARLAESLDGPPVVAMDELYPGWDGLEAAVGLLYREVVAPLLAGRPAGYPRYDWVRDAYRERRELGRPPLLLVEGVGAGARPIADHATLVLWVQAPRAERHRRGIARDGETYRPHWERWAAQEAVHFATERTADRADLRIDGDAGDAGDPFREVVLLHP